MRKDLTPEVLMCSSIESFTVNEFGIILKFIEISRNNGSLRIGKNKRLNQSGII